MRKIFVGKNEPAAVVVERILAETDEEIILVIPRHAQVAESLANFHLLNREADGAGKRLTVESVSEEVLALAKAAKIPAAHPLFSPVGSRSLSDIVPAAPEGKNKSSKRKILRHLTHLEMGRPEASAAAFKKKGRFLTWITFKPETPEEEIIAEAAAPGEDGSRFDELEEIELPAKPRRKRFSRRGFVVVIAVIILLGLGAWGTGTFFAEAKIRINFIEVPWENTADILATKAVAEVNSDGKILPAEVFRDIRNTTQFFPATGRAEVSEKARGRLTIYNAYSSQPQTLVATTRFETPDGKIFRLDNQVVVPGAEIKDGKIVPRSVETGVTADKAGEEYNVGPVEKLVIPGFKGTARYRGFYGALLQGAAGGFVGEKAVPTDADVAAAREKMAAILKSSLENNLLSGRPAEFKILPGASETRVTKMAVQRSTDEKGNFGIIGEAEFRAIGFREEDLKKLLLELARREHPDTDFRNLEINYSGVAADYGKGEVKFSVSARGELVPVFLTENFKSQAAGRDLNSVRSQILKLPQLADAEVSLWPVWLRRLPDNPEKITIILE